MVTMDCPCDHSRSDPCLKTVTLGCKVNQYETEYVRQGFQRLGYREAAEGEPADLCIVNTCTVTAESEAKSRKTIRRLARAHPGGRDHRHGLLCHAGAEEVAALPGVVEVVADKRELPQLLARRGLVDVPDRHLPLRTAAAGRMSRCRTAAGCSVAIASCRAFGRISSAGRSAKCSTRSAGWSPTDTARSC